MKLGQFDEQRARNEAISFLSKSITTLCLILGIKQDEFDENAPNPYDQSSPFYNAHNVLVSEVVALKKIFDSHE